MGKYWRDRYGTNCSGEFINGVKAGIQAYAWWRDGEQFVGTTGKSLKRTLREVEEELGSEDTDERRADKQSTERDS